MHVRISTRWIACLLNMIVRVPTLPQFADFPDPMLYSDYLPELSRHHESCGGPANPELGAEDVSWEDLIGMDLPSFQPAFLVLCRVLLNVIHECLKLRLEQRPAGEPSLLSIKQASQSWSSHSITSMFTYSKLHECTSLDILDGL